MIPMAPRRTDRFGARHRAAPAAARALACALGLVAVSSALVTPARGADRLQAGESRKVASLLGPGKYEASGVAVRGDAYYVVFDNRKAVGKLHETLEPAAQGNALVGPAGKDGFEGISYDVKTDRFFLVTETVEDGDELRSEVTVLDGELQFVSSHPLDFTFESENKGFEGIAHVRRQGQLYLLALCEGNGCKKGKAGRKGGKGRIQVFHLQDGDWVHVDGVKLPDSVEFEDYSGLDVRGDAIAVTSQMDSRLWIGRLASTGTGAEIDFKIDGKGKQFRFDEDDKIHCNVEGIAFLDDDTLVAASDRRKDEDDPRCAAKHQSVHVFTVP